MAPKSSSTAPEMRTTAPTLSSRAGLEGFTVTVAYACGPGPGRVGEGGPVTSAPHAPRHLAALSPEGPLYSGVDVQ